MLYGESREKTIRCYRESVLKKWDKFTAGTGSCELDMFVGLQAPTENVISKLVLARNREEGKRVFKIQKKQAEMVFRALWKIQLPGFRLRAGGRPNGGDGTKKTRSRTSRAVPSPEANAELQANLDNRWLHWQHTLGLESRSIGTSGSPLPPFLSPHFLLS